MPQDPNNPEHWRLFKKDDEIPLSPNVEDDRGHSPLIGQYQTPEEIIKYAARSRLGGSTPESDLKARLPQPQFFFAQNQSTLTDEDLAGFDSNVIALPRAAAGSLAKPEQAGQAVQLAQSTGFPSSIIGADLESYQQIDKGQKAAKAIQDNEWISGYVARNPSAAEVSNDDYDRLDTLSKKVQPFTIAGRQGGLLQAAPEFFLNTIPELGHLISSPEGRGRLMKGLGRFGEQFASILGTPGDAYQQGFDIHDSADMDRAQSLGLLIGMGKGSPKVGLADPAKGEIGPLSRSTPQEIDSFLHQAEGFKTRQELDDFLAQRAAGDKDPKTVLQIEHAKADSAALDAAVAAASETATKGRAPTLIEDFVRGHETGTLSIPAETIAEVYRAEGKAPAAGDGLFGFIPDLPSKLVMGAETGTEVDVPVASYLAHVDPTVHEKVKENIRFSNDGLTLAETKETEPAKIDTEAKPVEKTSFDTEQESLGLKPLFTEPLPGMTKPDFERYNKKVAAIQQKALDKATEVQTREAAKRRGEEWKANEAALRPEVEAQVRAFPDVAADRYLRTEKIKLDDGYVRALLDKTEIPEIMLGKDGIHPDDVAPLFGFNSGAEMVRALNDLATERRATKQSPTQHFNDLVNRELSAQMEAKYGNLSAAIADEARTLALDDLHFDILADELRALAAEAGGRIPLDKAAIKSLVQDHFSRLDAKTAADFEKFQKTAGRNGFLAERALLKGDPVEAFNAKQRQAMNFLLAKEASKFSKLVDRIAKKIDRVTKNDSIVSMDQEHFDQLKTLLSDLGFDTKGMPNRPATSLGDFVANSDGQLAVAAWLTDGTILPHEPSKLTVQQMTELGKSIDSMMHVGRAVKTLDSARGKAELQNVIFDIKGELDRFDFTANPLNPTVGQRAKSLARWVSAWSLLVERMLDYTDKFNPDGPLTTYLDRPLRDANVKEIQLNERVTRQLRKLSELTDNSINDIIPNNVIPSVRNESGFLDMTRRNLRQLMGYMGSESGIKKVVNGWGVAEADVWKLVNENATKADWQWVAGMHKIFEDLWAEAAEMIERDTGVPADKIEPKAMKSEKYGDFSGGYWPIKYDRIDSNIEGHIAGKRSLFDKHYVYAATPQAYTLPRTEWWGALDLTGQLLASHIRGVIHDIAFREPIRNAAKLINNQEFMTAMAQKWGKEYSGLLPGWLKDIANSHKVDDTYSQGIARVSSLIRQNMTSSLVGGNPSTVTKHGGTALGMSAVAVGEKSFLSAAWDFGVKGMLGAARDLVKGQKESPPTQEFTDALKAVMDPTEYGDGVRQFILDSSAVMRSRQRQSMDNIRDQMNKNLFAGTSLTGLSQGFMDIRGTAMDWVRVPVAMSDAVSAFPTWLAAYKQTMAKTGDHAQAVFEADKQVSRAHGSGFIGDKPLILRQGEAVRWLTPLYNFYNHYLNMMMNYYWDAKAHFKGREEPGANASSLARRAFWLGMMPIVFEELALPPLTEDKRGGIGIHMALTLFRHFGATIPIVRDFANAWTAGYDPGVGFLGTAYKAITNVMTDATRAAREGKKVSENWLIHMATAIGFATGMVPTQAGRTGSYIKDRFTGKERPPRTWDELRQGLRTGHSKPRVIR